LIKAVAKKEKYVMTMKLLADASGTKMSKTEGNAINLNDKPEEVYGKVMAMSDASLADAIEMLTDLPLGIIDDKGPMEAKKTLARDVVTQLCGKKEAEKAGGYFEKTFQKRQVPAAAKTVKLKEREMPLLDLVFESGEVASRSEGKRLIKEGAVDIDGMTMMDPQASLDIDGGVTLKVGKRRFVRVEYENS
jgi:tyrosyl-tRNA synthetase